MTACGAASRGTSAEATAITSRTDCVTPPPPAGPLRYSASTSWPTRSAWARVVQGPVTRHLLPQLGAVHFVLEQALGGGVTRSLALDAHGKTLSSAILDLPLDNPGIEPPAAR